jgi:hypothetical protein
VQVLKVAVSAARSDDEAHAREELVRLGDGVLEVLGGPHAHGVLRGDDLGVVTDEDARDVGVDLAEGLQELARVRAHDGQHDDHEARRALRRELAHALLARVGERQQKTATGEGGLQAARDVARAGDDQHARPGRGADVGAPLFLVPFGARKCHATEREY